MIDAQRGYELASRAIKTQDQLLDERQPARRDDEPPIDTSHDAGLASGRPARRRSSSTRPRSSSSSCSSPARRSSSSRPPTARRREPASGDGQRRHDRALPARCCRARSPRASAAPAASASPDELYQSLAAAQGIPTAPPATTPGASGLRPAVGAQGSPVSELLAHLARQVDSARKLLGIVLAPDRGDQASRTSSRCSRGSPTSSSRCARASSSSGSATRSSRLAAARLGVPRRTRSTSTRSSRSSPPPRPTSRAARSAELRGLLAEIRRVHTTEPRAHPAGALVPRPPDARPLRRARGRLLAERLDARAAGHERRRREGLMGDLDLPRPRDRAARHPRAAARDRRHRPQHRERLHARLLARDGEPRRRPSRDLDTPAGLLGTGVDVQSYQRVRDSYIDIQLRAQTMLKGYYEASRTASARSSCARRAVRQRPLLAARQVLGRVAERRRTRRRTWRRGRRSRSRRASLADGFNSLSSQLSRSQSQTTTSSHPDDRQVNSIGTQIAALNGSIKASNSPARQPNDLLDQRDLLVDQLAAARQRHRRR